MIFHVFFQVSPFFPAFFVGVATEKAMGTLPGQSEGAEGATVVNLVRRKEQVAILDAGTENSLDWWKREIQQETIGCYDVFTGNQWFLRCFYHEIYRFIGGLNHWLLGVYIVFWDVCGWLGKYRRRIKANTSKNERSACTFNKVIAIGFINGALFIETVVYYHWVYYCWLYNVYKQCFVHRL